MERPGWKTSEFWLSLGAQLIGLLGVLKLLPSADAESIGQAVTAIIGAVFVLIANAGVVVSYIRGRIELKTAENDRAVDPFLPDSR